MILWVILITQNIYSFIYEEDNQEASGIALKILRLNLCILERSIMVYNYTVYLLKQKKKVSFSIQYSKKRLFRLMQFFLRIFLQAKFSQFVLLFIAFVFANSFSFSQFQLHFISVAFGIKLLLFVIFFRKFNLDYVGLLIQKI